jgi:hypothetical protein
MLETAMTDVRTPAAADAIIRKNASVPEMIFFRPAPLSGEYPARDSPNLQIPQLTAR